MDESEKVKSNVNTCVHCSKLINGKPWITVHYPEDDYTVHACGYICGNRLKYHIGIGYWDNVVNKEDFNTNLIPVETFNPKVKTDITANFQREENIREILNEEKRIENIENSCGYSSSGSYNTEDDDY